MLVKGAPGNYTEHISNYLDLPWNLQYNHTLVGYKFVEHSDVVAASPVGAAPTTSSLSA